MAADDTLLEFVRDALGRGQSKPGIQQALLEAGWQEVQVKKALAAFADVDFPIPIPKPRPYLSAKEAFTYSVLFSMLYVSAFSLGQILFGLIDRTFPDPTEAEWIVRYTETSIRMGVSAFVVTFPIFLLVSRSVRRSVAKEPIKRTSRIRKWLTFFTLFLAFCFLAGDLISLVYNLLEGELAVRLLLKVLTVGLIAGSIFGYYLWELRLDDLESKA